MRVFFFLVHQNYVGTDTEKNPFFLSVVLSDQNSQQVPQYRAILWRKSVSTLGGDMDLAFGKEGKIKLEKELEIKQRKRVLV